MAGNYDISASLPNINELKKFNKNKMKTIKVTDKMYEFLKNLSHEINNREDNGTKQPFVYQVKQIKDVPNYGKTLFFENFFLTKKSCEQHIEMNKNNYQEPVAFETHLELNPEIYNIIRFLKELETI
jgi:hypothetical protein